MSSKIKIPDNVKIPKNIPKFVAPMKEGEVIQFSIEEKKKAILKEQDIFEKGEKDQSKRMKAVQDRNKQAREKFIKNKK